jgi:hypothetical protein
MYGDICEEIGAALTCGAPFDAAPRYSESALLPAVELLAALVPTFAPVAKLVCCSGEKFATCCPV